MANTSPPAIERAVGRHLEAPHVVRPVRLVREAGVDDVQQRFVGREREPVRLHEIRGHDGDAPARRIDAVDVAGADLARRRVAFVVRVDAVARVGEPDAAVALDHDVVRRIEALAVVAIGQHRARAVEFGARHRSGSGARTRRAGPARSTVLPLLFIAGWRNTDTEPSVSSQRSMRSFGMSDQTR